MRNTFIYILITLIVAISANAQPLCIVADDHTPAVVNGRKILTVCPGSSVRLSAVECSAPANLGKGVIWQRLNSDFSIVSARTVANDSGTYIIKDLSHFTHDTIWVRYTELINFAILNKQFRSFERICETDSVELRSTVNAGLSDYRWINANENQLIGQSDKVMIKNYPLGFFDIIATARYQGCLVSDTMAVVVTPIPTITIPKDTGFCKGGRVLLTSQEMASYTYKWSNNSTFFYTQITTAGKYTLEVTDFTTNCKAIDSVIVSEHPQPVLTLPQDQVVCPGAAVPLVAQAEGSGPFRFFWKPGNTLNDSTIANVIARPTAPETRYEVLLIDRNLCRDTGSFTLSTSAAVKAHVSFADTSICAGQEVTLHAYGSEGLPFAPEESTYPYNYQWSPASGMQDAESPSPKVTPVSNVIYKIKVTDKLGCTDSASVSIEIPQFSVAIESNKEKICMNDNVDLSGLVTGGTAPYTYIWSTDAQLSDPDKQNTNASPNAEVHDITLDVKDTRGCIQRATYQLLAIPLPIVTAVDTTYNICRGASIRFQPVTITGGNGNFTYTWTGSGLYDMHGPEPTFQSIHTDKGSLNFSVQVRDDMGCESNVAWVRTNVVIPPVVKLVSKDTTICEGSSITLRDLNFSESLNYEWWLEDEQFTQNEASLQVEKSSKIVLKGTEALAGCTSSDSISVRSIAAPSSLTLELDTIAYNNTPYNLIANAEGASLNYAWTTNGKGRIEDATKDHTRYLTDLTDLEYIYFTVSVKNICGELTVTDSIFFKEMELVRPALVYVPNVFSPASNVKVNSALMVFGNQIGMDDFKFQVFSRWGEVVYETSDLMEAMENGWNGTHKATGQPLSRDVYIYSVRGRFTNGENFETSGTATMIR